MHELFSSRSHPRWIRVLGFCATAAALALSAAYGRKSSSAAKPRPVVKLACVNSADAIASAHLAKAVLEQKLGCDVKLVMLDRGAAFKAVADGRADAFLDAWLPTTDEGRMKRYGKRLVDVGTLFRGARIGLVVPDYAPGRTIGDLRQLSGPYGGRIVGIDADSGIMMTAQRALRAYGLRWKLAPEGLQGMVAILASAVERREAVAVTGWSPHWVFARWKLRFLDDPKHVFGRSEDIHVVARRGLEKDSPGAASFLARFSLDERQFDSLLLAIRNAPEEPLAAAAKWMKQHPRLVDGWIEGTPDPKAR